MVEKLLELSPRYRLNGGSNSEAADIVHCLFIKGKEVKACRAYFLYSQSNGGVGRAVPLPCLRSVP